MQTTTATRTSTAARGSDTIDSGHGGGEARERNAGQTPSRRPTLHPAVPVIEGEVRKQGGPGHAPVPSSVVAVCGLIGYTPAAPLSP